jgi:hypothetical protein
MMTDLERDMTIKDCAEKYGRDPDGCFAAACYDDNTIEELREFTDVDITDCQTWGISEAEWRDSIQAALNDKLDDLE